MYIKKKNSIYCIFLQSGLKKIGYHLEARKNDAKEGNGKRETGGSNKYWEGNQAKKKEICSVKYER